MSAHTRCRASVLVVFVVFCWHMYSFAGLIRHTQPPTFSDTAISDRYSDTTIFPAQSHWVRYPGLLDRKKIVRTCANTLSTRPGAPLWRPIAVETQRFYTLIGSSAATIVMSAEFRSQERSVRAGERPIKHQERRESVEVVLNCKVAAEALWSPQEVIERNESTKS